MQPAPSRKTLRHAHSDSETHDGVSRVHTAATSRGPLHLDTLHIGDDDNGNGTFDMGHVRHKERRVEQQTLESMRQEVCMYLDAAVRSIVTSNMSHDNSAHPRHAGMCSPGRDDDLHSGCDAHSVDGSTQRIVKAVSTLYDAVNETYRILSSCFEFQGNSCDVFEPVRHFSVVTMHLLLTYGRFTLTSDGSFVVLGGNGSEELPWVGCLMMVLHRIVHTWNTVYGASQLTSCTTSPLCSLLAQTRASRWDGCVGGDGVQTEDCVEMSAPLTSRVLLLNCHNFGWLDADEGREHKHDYATAGGAFGNEAVASSTRYHDSGYTHRCVNALLNKAVYSYRAQHRYARHGRASATPLTASHPPQWMRRERSEKELQNEEETASASSRCAVVDTATGRLTSSVVVLLANTILMDGGVPSLDVWHSGARSMAHACYGRGLASLVIPTRRLSSPHGCLGSASDSRVGGVAERVGHPRPHAIRPSAVSCGVRVVNGVVAQALLLHPRGPLLLHVQFTLPTDAGAAVWEGTHHSRGCAPPTATCPEHVFATWRRAHCRGSAPSSPSFCWSTHDTAEIGRCDCEWHRELMSAAAWMLHLLSAPQPVLLVEWHIPEQQQQHPQAPAPSRESSRDVAHMWRVAAGPASLSPFSLVLRILAYWRNSETASPTVGEAVTAVTRAMSVVTGWSSLMGGPCVGDGALRPWMWSRGVRVYVDTAEACASSHEPVPGALGDEDEAGMERTGRGVRPLVLTSIFMDENAMDE